MAHEQDFSREQPGAYPYTRGIYPEMYRKKLWTMRQYAGTGTPKETNRRLKRLLSQGQTGLSVAFDLPTQLGIDPDDERAAGEVGTCGVSVPALPQLDQTLHGIPLAEISLSMTVNATAPAIFAMTASLAGRLGIAPHLLRGTIQNDMLKEFSARNLYIFPPEPSVRMAADLMEFCIRHYPRWHPVSVSGYHLREAGADAGQEIGFAIANGIAYLELLLQRNIHVDEVAPGMSFFFSAGSGVLAEAAKFRAARRLWAKLVRERFKAKNPESMKMKFHAQTAGSELTSVQPEHNIVRVTLQALAAVLGGAQSLHTNAKDEVLRLPTASSALLALRTQQIIAAESGIADLVDPLGGAYEIEALTDRLEDEARKWIQAVDAHGGALKAVEIGFVQKKIRESAYKDYEAIQTGKRNIVGVNRWETSRPIPVPTSGNTSAKRMKHQASMAEAIQRQRSSRSEEDAARAILRLLRDADQRMNIMPAMLEAVNTGCTIGEIYGALEGLFGKYDEEVTPSHEYESQSFDREGRVGWT